MYWIPVFFSTYSLILPIIHLTDLLQCNALCLCLVFFDIFKGGCHGIAGFFLDLYVLNVPSHLSSLFFMMYFSIQKYFPIIHTLMFKSCKISHRNCKPCPDVPIIRIVLPDNSSVLLPFLSDIVFEKNLLSIFH